MLSDSLSSTTPLWKTFINSVKTNFNRLCQIEPTTAQKVGGVALFAFASIACIKTIPTEELKKAFWDAYSATLLAEQLDGAPQEFIMTGKILSALFGSIPHE